MGLHRAWPDAEIVGVDIKPQPRYPFTFVLGDAMTFSLEGFDFVWASPPCQHYTQMLNHGRTDRAKHPNLIGHFLGRVHVVENVMAAPMRRDLYLCGEMFGLRVIRHRQFECSFPIIQPKHIPHRGTGNRKQGDGGYYLRVYGHETSKPLWGAAMGIDWMRTPELAQAIPPAYSQYIGEQFSKVTG
jgi:DNA (cytosine-5)-methyltransferase 1